MKRAEKRAGPRATEEGRVSGTDQHRRLCLCLPRPSSGCPAKTRKLRSGQRQVKHPHSGQRQSRNRAGLASPTKSADEARVGDAHRSLPARPICWIAPSRITAMRLDIASASSLVMRHVDDRQVSIAAGSLAARSSYARAVFLSSALNGSSIKSMAGSKMSARASAHTLLLSAGKFGRISVGENGPAVRAPGPEGCAPARSCLSDLAEAQRESDVVAHRHVGKRSA